jgi:exopolysaccharide biosynthesis polyprenyl glycosylphosphotransferase
MENTEHVRPKHWAIRRPAAFFSGECHRASTMLGRRQKFNAQLTQLVDAGLLVLSLWLGHLIRQHLSQHFPFIPEIDPFNIFLWLTLTMPLGPLLLEFQGFYRFPLQRSALESFRQIVQALFWLGVLIAGCAFLFKFDIHSRAVLLLFGLISTALLLIRDQVVVIYLRKHLEHAKYQKKVILAGTSGEIRKLAMSFIEEQRAQIKIVETIDILAQSTSNLMRSLQQHSVGLVIFASPLEQLPLVEEAIRACEVQGVETWLVADFIRTSIARVTFEMFGTRPMLVFRSTPDLSWSLFLKRAIDLCAALCGLIALAPLLIIVAVAIKVTSPGPLIFKQMRSGRYGRPFRMFKFRSMYADAEQRRVALESHNQMSGPVFKINNDPRITPIGRWLRKYSIDELPQLLNVLIGEMSLVGPRPLPIYEVEKFSDPAQRRRLSVKPGLTCLWQISGRNEVKDFEEWVKLDLDYIDNWSIWVDLKILLGTIPVVVLAYGAK